MDCLGLGARGAARAWERGVRGEDGLVPPRMGGSRGGADPVLPLLTLKSQGWKRSCGSSLPSPSRHRTVNRSGLGEQGRGRVFVARPAWLFQKQRERHTPNPPVQLPTRHPHQRAPRADGFHSWTRPEFRCPPQQRPRGTEPEVHGGRGFLPAAAGAIALHHAWTPPAGPRPVSHSCTLP